MLLPEMKTMREIEAETGISYGTLRRWCKQGFIRYRKVGKKWLINCDSLKRYMEEGESNESDERILQN